MSAAEVPLGALYVAYTCPTLQCHQHDIKGRWLGQSPHVDCRLQCAEVERVAANARRDIPQQLEHI